MFLQTYSKQVCTSSPQKCTRCTPLFISLFNFSELQLENRRRKKQAYKQGCKSGTLLWTRCTNLFVHKQFRLRRWTPSIQPLEDRLVRTEDYISIISIISISFTISKIQFLFLLFNDNYVKHLQTYYPWSGLINQFIITNLF